MTTIKTSHLLIMAAAGLAFWKRDELGLGDLFGGSSSSSGSGLSGRDMSGGVGYDPGDAVGGGTIGAGTGSTAPATGGAGVGYDTGSDEWAQPYDPLADLGPVVTAD